MTVVKKDAKPKGWGKWEQWLEDRIVAIWTNLLTNHLWQRMLKNTFATTITIILAFIPALVEAYGKAIYLAPVTSCLGHPGRRFGQMAEALVLTISGTSLGVCWATLGIYLSSLIYAENSPAAYTIKGIFLAVAFFFHGFVRSHAPRLFIFTVLFIIVSVVSLTTVATTVSSALVLTLFAPILTATGILLLVNVLLFPEFSSSFLGVTTIETLGETVTALRDASSYFVAIIEPTEQEDGSGDHLETGDHVNTGNSKVKLEDGSEDPGEKSKSSEKDEKSESFFVRIWTRMHPEAEMEKLRKEDKSAKKESSDNNELNNAPQEPNPAVTTVEKVKLASLTATKAKLRAKLADCKAAQKECNFELVFAVLRPRDLQCISDTEMKKLVANTIALIGACESKYALMGDNDEGGEDDAGKSELRQREEDANLKSSEEEDDGSLEKDDQHRSRSWRGKGKSKDESQSGLETPTGDSIDSDVSTDDEKKAEQKEYDKLKKKHKSRDKTRLEREIEDLELVKPRKEIEFGDIELLLYLIKGISPSILRIQDAIDENVNTISSCMAFCYDVPKLPSGARPPKGIQLQELDIRLDAFTAAIASFDRESAAALEDAAAIQTPDAKHVDIMPRMETFLVSSFILNLHQAALHTLEMLKNARKLVEKRQSRHERRRLYAPRIEWRKWLTSGGEEDGLALPAQGRKDMRTGTMKIDNSDLEQEPSDSSESLIGEKRKDVETGPNSMIEPETPKHATKASRVLKKKKSSKPFLNRCRNWLADFMEYVLASEDVLYAMKITVAGFLVSWPAFVGSWNEWYYLNRGLWAALQLVLITEVAIGTSVMTFLLRAGGTSLGCLWGYAAYTSRNGNPYTTVAILVIGIIPSTYVQLGSKYVKAGIVSIISMCIVSLATVVQTTPSTATENFLKRFIAFLIGGIVALIVEVTLFPVRARDRLVESLAAACEQIIEMEACLAYGVETEVNVDVHSTAVSERFEKASTKAEGALAAAETFLPFCANEPRLKGSFEGLALVYSEILYVLHQIVDKMDNMLQLRKNYGSGVLEEWNAQVYPYRRNVAGSITLVLFAVHEALTTKLPLPQFLPSARLSHLRMVNRVREVAHAEVTGKDGHGSDNFNQAPGRSNIEQLMVKKIVRQKFLSWNAASAGQIEVIEYLEELIDLTKLLVGANEFKSGMLTRPTYSEYVNKITQTPSNEIGKKDQLHPQPLSQTAQKCDTDVRPSLDSNMVREQEELRDTFPPTKLGLTKTKTPNRRRAGTTSKETKLKTIKSGGSSGASIGEEDELPLSLQRVRSRRVEERLEMGGKGKDTAEDSWASGSERSRRG